MRRFIFIVSLCLMFTISAFADDSVVTESAIADLGTAVVVDNSNVGSALDKLAVILSQSAINSPSGDLITENPVQIVETPVLTDVSVTAQRVTPSDTNGLKALMLTLIGDYETVVTDYTYQSSSGYQNHSIEIEQDYAWICTCALWIVVIFCAFKLVGGILCKR